MSSGQTSAGPNEKPGHLTHVLRNAGKIIEIARTQAARLTLQELQELLPKGTTIGEPSWLDDDIATGNVAELQGSLLGLVIFHNDQQRTALRVFNDLVECLP